jgi:hypothetical protein
LAKPNQPLTVAISGGKPPYDLVVVDPGLKVGEKGLATGGAVSVEVTIESIGRTRRLLITDQADTQQIVEVQSAAPVTLPKRTAFELERTKRGREGGDHPDLRRSPHNRADPGRLISVLFR